METGELVQWNDERGFGFVVTPDRTRYFIHISEIGRIATRPRVGDQLRFRPSIGSDGRPVAKAASVLGANPVPPPLRRAPAPAGLVADWRYFAALAVAALVVFDWSSGVLPDAVLLAYGIMACLSMLTYAADKSYAETGHWRVRETTLHALDMCGGIAGGLLAQAVLRHKTRKPSFQLTTLLIMALQVGLLGGLGARLWSLSAIF